MLALGFLYLLVRRDIGPAMGLVALLLLTFSVNFLGYGRSGLLEPLLMGCMAGCCWRVAWGCWPMPAPIRTRIGVGPAIRMPSGLSNPKATGIPAVYVRRCWMSCLKPRRRLTSSLSMLRFG
ncbi:MAG TPA: hypothetical protein DCS43_10115 [Verrucomicrobia bacterium]|nr:hypothetical protein [Verrucomicrobiota bacterium]